jgi:PAS domain S-box-containing protein
MSQDKIDILQRALNREKSARKIAEKILEDKSRDLYFLSEELKTSNSKLENLLDEKSSQLQGVFENIIDSYLVMELSGDILKMNDAAIELFGYNSKEEKVNVNNLIYSEDTEYASESYNELTEKGFFSNFTTRILTKDKKVKWVQVNGSLIYDRQKNPIAAQGIIRDISVLKSLEQQKEKIRKELEKSNNELQEYAHIVSHDLKTPLRSIDALVSWIKMDNTGKLDEITTQNLELIEKTLETMENLISNVLEYSSAGAVLENVKDIDLNITFQDVLRLLFIPENVTVNVLNKLPIIKGDTTKFQQIFQNLVSNAIKFSDKENGIVDIDFIEKPSFYQFSVKDNGIGIEKKYHDKIFKIFHSLNKSKESTGIGLSIVKKVIELYEGSIWLESELNKGTTFYFTIKK